MFDILDNHIHNDSVQKVSIIHLWGHSYEIQENNNWKQLEQLFKHIYDHRIQTKTNFEIFKLGKKCL